MEDFEKYNNDSKMKYLLSNKNKYSQWRKLWVAMAEVEKELGLSIIGEEDIKIMRENSEITDEEMIVAKEIEGITKHDVMAHIECFKKKLGESGKIVHLGCTSCYVQDNADMLIFIEGLKIIRNKLIMLLQLFDKLIMKERDTICIGRTHLQEAQFVTVGKRFVMFSQDIWLVLRRLESTIENDLFLLGGKGATGTQCSYVNLVGKEKAKLIDQMLSEKLGVKVIPLSGQTYPRILDNFILDSLKGIASVLYRIGLNVRMWQMMKEVYEPFEDEQVGSSAMPYKQNPMRCERICSLADFVMKICAVDNNMHQGFERTLDDSANRRLVMRQALVLVNYIISLMCNVVNGIVVMHQVIDRVVRKQINYAVTENILMEMCKMGKDRNECHEKIKEITFNMRVKELKGDEYSIVEELRKDNYFEGIMEKIDGMLDPKLNSVGWIGLCREQVDSYREMIGNDYLDIKCEPFDMQFYL